MSLNLYLRHRVRSDESIFPVMPFIAGVGGIEAEAVMLGQPISMVLPQVIGYRLMGKPHPLVTSTDIVLTITKVTICNLFCGLGKSQV